MKIAFRQKLGMSPQNEQKLSKVNEIIADYARQGYKLTLRQLYYQLVSKDIVPNVQSEYAKLSTLLVKGRMAGRVDWNAIEDRLRQPFLEYWAKDVPAAIQDTIDQYKIDRQEDQDVYIEVWVEKDALSGVLRKITSHYHINLMVNRGYSSCSAMFQAYARLKRHQDKDKKIVILYLGDHDASGLDMIRDIKDRLTEFGVHPTVEHIGITKDQIEEYNPPPNPAKITDPRADWYIAEHGNKSWEVDALPPKILHELITEHVEALIDMDKFNDKIDQEGQDKEELRELQELADKHEEEEE